MVMWTPIAQQRMFLRFSILIYCTKKFSDNFYEDKPKEKSAAKKSKNGKSTFKTLELLHNRESKNSREKILCSSSKNLYHFGHLDKQSDELEPQPTRSKKKPSKSPEQKKPATPPLISFDSDVVETPKDKTPAKSKPSSKQETKKKEWDDDAWDLLKQ
jgi:hypothetical protein